MILEFHEKIRERRREEHNLTEKWNNNCCGTIGYLFNLIQKQKQNSSIYNNASLSSTSKKLMSLYGASETNVKT